MSYPDKLMFDHLQSDNYEPESSPGAGDGKGWRLSKNGDFQIGTATCLNGEIFSPHGNVRVDSRQFELGFDMNQWPKRVYLTQEQIDAAKCDLPAHIVHKPGIAGHKQIEPLVWSETARLDPIKVEGRELNPGMVTTLDLVVTVEGVSSDPEKMAQVAAAIRQTVHDVMGVPRYSIEKEQTVRASADEALASRIGALDVADGTAWGGIGRGLDLGKEYLAIPQPGGDVKLGRLGGKPLTAADFAGGLVEKGALAKCSGRDTFTEQFLNREVRSDLKPEVACALSMAAPMTANGKVPINNLPRPVDDDK